MNTMRLVFLFAGLSFVAPAVQAAEAPAVGDQPAASSSLLDRLFPTTPAAARPVKHHRLVARHLQPHDVAKPVMHVAHADPHEKPSPAVARARIMPVGDRGSEELRLAVLDRRNSCDSILCPGYSMLGVGF